MAVVEIDPTMHAARSVTLTAAAGIVARTTFSGLGDHYVSHLRPGDTATFYTESVNTIRPGQVSLDDALPVGPPPAAAHPEIHP